MNVKIYNDSLHRIAYATDASIFREIPCGVAFPKTAEEIACLVKEAQKRGVCLIPRAGGTSVAGQVVGNGLVVDISRYLDKVISIDAENRRAIVQPGVVRDELNLRLKPYNLFFSPETSTSNRCCIGGMAGNNSCGTHSLIYGSTRHHILEAKGILSDGTLEDFKTYTIWELENRFGMKFWESTTSGDSVARQIYSQLINFALDSSITSVIDENYPDRTLRRRSCGYAIDEVIEGLRDEGLPFRERMINLCTLLCGSEGTLAFIYELTLDLDFLPPEGKAALCIHCDTLEKCYRANLVCLRHQPDAVELIDGTIIDLSRQNGAQSANSFFVKGEPAGLLVAEFTASTTQEAEAKAKALEEELTTGPDILAYCCTTVYNGDISKVWSLRKAGLGLLSGMKGDAKPIGVIEDTAVAPERLPEYLKEFNEMLERLGLSCVFYGHISTGELHLRPIINIKTPEGRKLFRRVAEETALLVKKHRGSLSGEHGDGRLRGEFIPLLYGAEVYRLMCDVKDCWDSRGVFNVGKIVRTPPMDDFLRFDVNQSYALEKLLKEGETYFNWRAEFDECKIKNVSGVRSQIHALMCSLEQCNGAGDCRKSNLIGGTLCPAFKVSGDETKATRARANVLREILTHGFDSPVFIGKGGNLLNIPDLTEVLDSCLACKGCKKECPSNVDMTRLRAEILQHIHDSQGTPLTSLLVSRMASIMRLGSYMVPVYNFFAKGKFTSYIIKRILKFSVKREIPTLSKTTMRRLVRQAAKNRESIEKSKGKVFLFADEFTNYQEAELGMTFSRLLMSLGYTVEIPHHLESGRAAISKGNLRYARRCAEKNLALLKDIITNETSLVGIEPSCILSFRDEYPDLVAPGRREEARKLAENCLLYDEFLLREIEKGNISADDFLDTPLEIWLHGHCHLKALVGIEKTASVLRMLHGVDLHVIPSGCCGMAGSFGYEKRHYDVSMAIGEMILFPTVRKAVASARGEKAVIVAAPGTSCRAQIKDGTGVTAVHPVQILASLLRKRS